MSKLKGSVLMDRIAIERSSVDVFGNLDVQLLAHNKDFDLCENAQTPNKFARSVKYQGVG